MQRGHAIALRSIHVRTLLEQRTHGGRVLGHGGIGDSRPTLGRQQGGQTQHPGDTQ
jgi:hypothetical protein